jgi:hypothetical protein
MYKGGGLTHELYQSAPLATALTRAIAKDNVALSCGAEIETRVHVDRGITSGGLLNIDARSSTYAGRLRI